MGDIDSMFYQVRVPPVQSHWWEDGNSCKQMVEYQMNVHLFGATSSPYCSNCRGRFSDDVINAVLRNVYLDDCLKSVNIVSDAISLVKDLQDVLNLGGFHIAK